MRAFRAFRSSVATALLLCVLLAGCDSAAAEAGHQTLTLDGRPFTLELALDDATRFRGLSDREEIPADGGMLFVFPDAKVRYFVMRRCLVPIDIIFLGPGGRIVQMHEMQVEPYDTPEEELKRYSSVWRAQYAIELRGGTLRTLKLAPGPRIEVPEDLKRRAR